MSRNLQMLKIGKNILSQHAKKLIYYGHIYSHISYCVSTWGPMISNQQVSKLQKLQDQCVNLIDLTRKPIELKYLNNKILKVPEIISVECSKLGYRIIKNQLPQNLLTLLSSDQSGKTLKKSHHYQTRRKNLPNMPKAKSSQ